MAKCAPGAPLEASCSPKGLLLAPLPWDSHGKVLHRSSPGSLLLAPLPWDSHGKMLPRSSPGGLLLASLPWDSHGKVLPRSFPGGLLLGFLPWDSRGSVVPRIPVCRALGGLVLEGSASVWGLPSGSPGCVPEASFSRDLRLYGVSWRPSSLCFLDAGRPLGSTLASPNFQSPGGPRSKKEGSAAVGGAIKD